MRTAVFSTTLGAAAAACLLSTSIVWAGQDASMKFSDAKNTAPTTVEVTVQIQNPDGTWGSVLVPPITIPPLAPAAVKRDLILAQLQQSFGAANATSAGSSGLNLHLNVDAAIRVGFIPGATGENPDHVLGVKALRSSASFAGHFDPLDYSGQPAIFTAGIVTDVGELSDQVTSQELNFQTDGPIICQALFQRLAPRAPQYGAQINYAGDRLEVYFDPAYTVTTGGVLFGTTSKSPGCTGQTELPRRQTLGDMNCDGVSDFDDITPFILALSNPATYQAAYPNCNILNGDCNGDGAVDFDDINAFIGLLGG